MSDLVVIGFSDEFKADEVRLELMKLQSEYLLDLEDAVVAVKKADGNVRLHQSHSLPTAGAVGGGFWGLLIGTLFLNPILGAVAGAAAGAAAGALSDIGINDHFMKELASTLQPGSSADFQVEQPKPLAFSIRWPSPQRGHTMSRSRRWNRSASGGRSRR